MNVVVVGLLGHVERGAQRLIAAQGMCVHY